MVLRVISCVRLTCPSTPPLVYLADGTCSGPVRLLHPPPASVRPPHPGAGPRASRETRGAVPSQPPALPDSIAVPSLDVAFDAIPPVPLSPPHHGIRGRLVGRAPRLLGRAPDPDADGRRQWRRRRQGTGPDGGGGGEVEGRRAPGAHRAWRRDVHRRDAR